MLESQPAARSHLRFVPGRNGHAKTRRHQYGFPRRNRGIFCRAHIHPRSVGCHIRGQRKPLAMRENMYENAERVKHGQLSMVTLLKEGFSPQNTRKTRKLQCKFRVPDGLFFLPVLRDI